MAPPKTVLLPLGMGGTSVKCEAVLLVPVEEADTAASLRAAGAADAWLRNAPPSIAITRTDSISHLAGVGQNWFNTCFDGIRTPAVACWLPFCAQEQHPLSLRI